MKSIRCRSFLFGLIFLSGPGLVVPSLSLANQEEEGNIFSNWNLFGHNTLSVSYYDTAGDISNSSYPDRYRHMYNDISVNVNRQFTPYHSVKGNIAGVFNDSDYRYNSKGFILERFNITEEQGETKIPYRLEVGDIYGFFTPRTVQKSLKGTQIEIQPASELWGAFHGVQFLVGEGSARDYHDSLTTDTYFGGSWLLQWPKTGLSFNLIANSTEADLVTNTGKLDQYTTGIAVNRMFSFLNQQLEIDSEFSHFNGNPAGTGQAAENVHNDVNGFFARLTGKSKSPMTYNFLFEDYGQGYLPKGASVSQDRRTVSGSVGWRFKSGVSLRGRRQIYAENKDTTNQTDTNVWGVSLSGAIPSKTFPDMNVNIDTFINKSEDENKSFKTTNRSVSTYLSTTLVNKFTGSLQLNYQDTTNDLTHIRSNETRTINTGVNHPVQIRDLSGAINGNVTYTEIRANNTKVSDDMGLNMGVNMGVRGHQLSAALFYKKYQPVGVDDTLTDGVNLTYGFTKGQHSIKFDGSINKRAPENAISTTDYRVALTYGFRFGDSGGNSTYRPSENKRELQGNTEVSLVYKGKYLTDLAPGIPRKATSSWLAAAGIGKGVSVGNTTVYETRFFESINRRQRLVLVNDSLGNIELSAIIIDTDNNGTPETIKELYNEISSLLVKKYGIPQIYEEGDFGANFAAQVRNNQFIRNTEWFTNSGILRLGIPRRLDGTVRIELQLRKKFPSQKDTLWSIQQVL